MDNFILILIISAGLILVVGMLIISAGMSNIASHQKEVISEDEITRS
ncbi:hypothetical protein ACFQ1Q_12045 [Winogradskyella litorisediminis]|uniref:NADH dehydrogenase subunit 3 n=1 Tax=Winogradskyella litorisediminis TaxID=1156618 RepID=A0ABW3N8H0_9FLAO